jgi:hypothetical protein
MICGDPAQIQAEINIGTIIVQYLLTIPIVGWVGVQMKNMVQDVKSRLRARKGTRNNKDKTLL